MNAQNQQVQTVDERIAQRIDPSVAGLGISSTAGGLAFSSVTQAMEMAKLMAISGVAIPKHLRGNPGACLAVVIQAVEWRLSPYAVANKSYSVNDRLAYESQLIQAVILQRAPIKGRFKVEYQGQGENRVCRVSATLADTGEVVDYTSPAFGRIKPKNSPLWATDPDQQQFYYSGRALCRRHFPDVLLGIFDRDEIERDPDEARDITPAASGPKTLAGRLDALAAKPEAETVTETIDAETGEITDVMDAVEDQTERPTDPTQWSVPYAYHYGEEQRAKGTTRKAVVPPEIRDHPTLAAAVVSGWERGEPAVAELRV